MKQPVSFVSNKHINIKKKWREPTDGYFQFYGFSPINKQVYQEWNKSEVSGIFGISAYNKRVQLIPVVY